MAHLARAQPTGRTTTPGLSMTRTDTTSRRLLAASVEGLGHHADVAASWRARSSSQRRASVSLPNTFSLGWRFMRIRKLVTTRTIGLVITIAHQATLSLSLTSLAIEARASVVSDFNS